MQRQWQNQCIYYTKKKRNSKILEEGHVYCIKCNFHIFALDSINKIAIVDCYVPIVPFEFIEPILAVSFFLFFFFVIEHTKVI